MWGRTIRSFEALRLQGEGGGRSWGSGGGGRRGGGVGGGGVAECPLRYSLFWKYM